MAGLLNHPCIPILTMIGTIAVYKCHVGTDIYTAFQYSEMPGHKWYSFFTGWFILIPMIITAPFVIVYTAADKLYHLSLLSLICFPLSPLVGLYYSLISSIIKGVHEWRHGKPGSKNSDENNDKNNESDILGSNKNLTENNIPKNIQVHNDTVHYNLSPVDPETSTPGPVDSASPTPGTVDFVPPTPGPVDFVPPIPEQVDFVPSAPGTLVFTPSTSGFRAPALYELSEGDSAPSDPLLNNHGNINIPCDGTHISIIKPPSALVGVNTNPSSPQYQGEGECIAFTDSESITTEEPITIHANQPSVPNVSVSNTSAQSPPDSNSMPIYIMPPVECKTVERTYHHDSLVEFIKLIHITESLPQSSLTMHIIFQTMEKHGVEGVQLFQWMTLAFSLVAFAVFIPSKNYSKQIIRTKIIGKTLNLLITLLFITCRLMVCCTYSALHSGYWFIAIGSECILWVIFVCCKLDESKVGMAVLSSIYIWFAIGGLYIALPKKITTTSLVLNIVMSLIQFCISCSRKHKSEN